MSNKDYYGGGEQQPYYPPAGQSSSCASPATGVISKRLIVQVLPQVKGATILSSLSRHTRARPRAMDPHTDSLATVNHHTASQVMASHTRANHLPSPSMCKSCLPALIGAPITRGSHARLPWVWGCSQQQEKGGGADGCCACLAGMCLCCCAEGPCSFPRTRTDTPETDHEILACTRTLP